MARGFADAPPRRRLFYFLLLIRMENTRRAKSPAAKQDSTSSANADLFDACEYVLALCEEPDMAWDCLESTAIPMLRKAIAKAKGE